MRSPTFAFRPLFLNVRALGKKSYISSKSPYLLPLLRCVSSWSGLTSQFLPVPASCKPSFMGRCHCQMTDCCSAFRFKFLIINQINSILFFHPTFSLSSSIVRHFLLRNISYIYLLASIQASFLPIQQHYILPFAAVLLSDILIFLFLGRCSRPIYIPLLVSISSIFLYSSSSIFFTTSPPILQSPSFPSCTVSWTILLTFTSSQSWYSRVRHHRLLSACFVHQVLDHQPSPRGTFGLLLPCIMPPLFPYHATTCLSTNTFEVAI